MILSKLLLLLSICLFLSPSFGLRISKAKAERLLRRAKKYGEDKGGEMGRLLYQYNAADEYLNLLLEYGYIYHDAIGGALSVVSAKNNLKDVAKKFKKNPTTKNFERFLEAKEDLETELGIFNSAMEKVIYYNRVVGKQALNRQSVAIKMIQKMMDIEEEEKKARKRYRQELRERRKEKRKERRKKKDDKAKATEAFIGTFVGAAGTGTLAAWLGGSSGSAAAAGGAGGAGGAEVSEGVGSITLLGRTAKSIATTAV